MSIVRHVIFLLTIIVPALAGEKELADFFEAKVRPVLATRCYTCHTDSASGGLRLDSRQSLLKGGKSGAAITPGNAADSILIQAVGHTHPRLKMPPSGDLDPTQIANLKEWITQGAVWPESPAEFFASRVKPVLEAKCFACHTTNPQGGLRLDSLEAMIKGGKSGPAIRPGHPSESLLIHAISYNHALVKMPPAGQLPKEDFINLSRWVEQGAVWSNATQPAPRYEISAKQKAFWSFQPLSPPAVTSNSKNPVDVLIKAKLTEQGLTSGKPADRPTLLRRATFDLTGLPPTAEEVRAFAMDKDPNAFEKVVNRLLASRQYAERWGRHWLDVVRYADTAGDGADFPVPEAYKYRNYVIDAFGKDKPYDQFVREQIAGDLLPSSNEEQRWEQTIATGYLALSRRIGVSPRGERHVTIEDTIDNFGKTFLGLSVSCARCHDHKFDPIPTADYYALYGIFDSTVYPFNGEEHLPYRSDFVYRIGKEKASEILGPYEKEFAEWKKLERKKFTEYQEFQNRRIDTPGRSREVVWNELLKIRAEMRPHAERFPALETAYAMSEGTGHDVNIQKMGEPKMKGDVAPRGFLQILGGQKLPQTEKGSGRLQLAEWVTNESNPLTARVMVNRIWHHHFGKGLVSSTSDFGVRGTLPTNSALLDYLASEFKTQGWSVKAMHRLIMLSDTYQLASADVPANSAKDPQNDFHWRQNRRRLDAESINDGIRFLSASLDPSAGGRHPMPNERTYFFRQHEPFTEVYPNNRRSVYSLQGRIQKNPYLDLFDGPDGNLPMNERKQTTTSLQALFLLNSNFMHEQSASIAERLLAAAINTPQRVEWAYQRILNSVPSSEEVAKAEQFLAVLRQQYSASGCTIACEQKAWASYLRSLLGSNRFLYLD